MLVIPAIDLRGGRCVRLVQGDPERQTTYSDDPAAVAAGFERDGAKLIHIVDLDGAFEGRPVNHEVVKKIVRSVSIPVEIGGGIRNGEAVSMYRDAGIGRIILGTAVLEQDVRSLVDRFRGLIVAGVDARDGMVATHGWKNVTSVSSMEMIKQLQNYGIRDFIYTDISTDGMLGGPNYNAFEAILAEVNDIALVASGGVSAIDDIRRLKEVGNGALWGCIVGKAIYDGRVRLEDALRLE
jgi:phosphoribosylformimino-5-aminoimidazole carboxamide ribotide isomerase